MNTFKVISKNAAPIFRLHWPFIFLLAGLTAFQLWGVSKVPFHPDEATYLFMSSDLEALFTRPGQLGFDPDKADDPRQTYRTIDAPLTRYVLGLGRWAFGIAALPVDWDWGKTWDENAAAGALPSPELLLAGRLAMTLLMPLSLVLAYAIGLEMGGRWTGWAAALLLGLNALALLHGRRAMAEGVLIFGVLFAFWSFLRGGKHAWLAGLGMAIAFNSKQSALALLPVGVLAVVWTESILPRLKSGLENPLKRMESTTRFNGFFVSATGFNRWHMGRIAGNLLQFLAVFGLVTLALNPIYWRNPVEAVQASLATRQDLLSRQVADAQRLAPGQVLDTPVKRLAVMLGHLYVLPLQFYEIGNYQTQTEAAEEAYLAVSGHVFLRGLTGGGLVLALTLIGMVRGVLEIRRKGIARSVPVILLFLTTGLMGAALLAAVPLPFQRYSIPLLPLVVLWMGLGMKGFPKT